MATIILPYGNSTFESDDLIKYIRKSGRDYIIQGQQACSLEKHTKPNSLDFWLRANFASNQDTKQADNEVIELLVATGDFKEGRFICPDSGIMCKGIEVIRKKKG